MTEDHLSRIWSERTIANCGATWQSRDNTLRGGVPPVVPAVGGN